MSDTTSFGGGSGAYDTKLSFGAAPATPVAGPIKDTTTASFAADVIQESRNQPVLVDFWAPWCGPCKQLQPALERVVAASGGRVKLVKMNIDEHPGIAGQLGIQSIPAVIAFKNGKPVDGFMGAVPESQIKAFIDKVGGPGAAELQVADLLAAAAEARGAGDLQGAVELYDAILQQAPDTLDAIAGLAQLLFDAGDKDGALDVLSHTPEGKDQAPQIVAVRSSIALAEQAAGLGDPRALRKRLEADPSDHQARFDLAMIQNALGERGDAADGLLAIVKANREWNEDGARAQLLKFFEAWGMADPATLSARRKLSSVLFS